MITANPTIDIKTPPTVNVWYLDSGVAIFGCLGSPESAVAALPGSFAVDVNTGNWYRKASGTGNAGWSPMLDTDALTPFTQVVDGAAVTGTVVETTLLNAVNGSKTLAANSTRVGEIVQISAGGTFSTSGAASLTIRVKVGAVTLLTLAIGTLGAVGARRWTLDAEILVRTLGGPGVGDWGCQGLFSYSVAVGAGSAVAQTSAGNGILLDTTVAQTLDITAQWGAADASSIACQYASASVKR